MKASPFRRPNIDTSNIQIASPEVWDLCNTYPLPPSGYFGVNRDSYFYRPAQPRTREEKDINKVRMINKLGQEVLAPYYGLSSLSKVSYLEVARKTTAVVPPGPPSEDLIKKVFFGIILNVFHFEYEETKVKVRDQVSA